MKNIIKVFICKFKYSMKLILKSLLYLFFYPIKHFVKKSNIVLLSGADDQFYCGNSRYLYEFLSKDLKLRVYYYTNSIEVQKYLKLNNLQFISLSRPFELIILMLQAKVVINTGDSYLNFFGITNVSSVFKICLNHGSGPKIESNACESFWEEHVKKTAKFNFVNFPSDFTSSSFGKDLYSLPVSKIISLGYPRCDQFFNKNLVNESFVKKEYLKKIFGDEFGINNKTILYTPTWRPYDYEFPLLKMKGLELLHFNKWLKDNNLYFIYTSHLSIDINKQYQFEADRIKMINRRKFNLFDINKLMMEVDILLNDYSTSSVDFSILGKPQIFFLPDANTYSKKVNFIDEYRASMPGIEIKDYNLFVERIIYILNNEKKYLSDYRSKNTDLLEKYLYTSYINSCSRFNEFINTII